VNGTLEDMKGKGVTEESGNSWSQTPFPDDHARTSAPTAERFNNEQTTQECGQ